MANSHDPLRYELEVPANGRIEIQVPLPAASRVTVYVVEEQQESDELLAASLSSIDFWDNPQDDEDWNDA